MKKLTFILRTLLYGWLHALRELIVIFRRLAAPMPSRGFRAVPQCGAHFLRADR